MALPPPPQPPQNQIPKKKASDLSMAEQETLIQKPISECTQLEKDLKLEILEARLAGIQAVGNMQGVGPDDMVVITVPLKTDGEMFEINLTKYYGRTNCTKRTADQLMVLMSDHFDRAKDLLKDRGNLNRNKGNQIRGENAIVMERYHQIMEG